MASLEIGAIVQGLAAAIVFLSLIALYIDRMSSISENLETISDSIENVRDDVHEVDLKHMERTNNKLESFLDANLSQQYGNPSGNISGGHGGGHGGRETGGTGGGTTGGQNSVEYRLEKTGIDVTISYVGDPKWHAGLSSHGEWEGSETIFHIMFDEEVDTHGLLGLLVKDDRLGNIESNLFDGYPVRLTAESPFLISCAVPTEDLAKTSEWVAALLKEIDSNIEYINDLSETFDENIMMALKK